MSVTVRNLLKLPSLANATVIAGKEGLDKIVASVSVLETMEYELIDDHAYLNDEFIPCGLRPKSRVAGISAAPAISIMNSA